jgi:hypothetical protein
MIASLDPSLYPASYRTSAWRGSLKILGFMALFLLSVLGRTHIIDRGVAPWVLVFIILMALFLLLTLINIIFAQITLYPDRIERVTWFGRKSMPRADVAKLQRRGLFKTPLLVSKRGAFEGILLPSGIKPDAAWETWMTVAQDGDAGLARDTLNATSAPNRSLWFILSLLTVGLIVNGVIAGLTLIAVAPLGASNLVRLWPNAVVFIVLGAAIVTTSRRISGKSQSEP